MIALVVVLAVLLVLSLLAIGVLWYRWHTYRAQPSGQHSWTNMMPAIKVKR